MKNLYHITTDARLPYILTDGLIPMIGKNSEFNEEKEAAIYLTDYDSMPASFV